MARTVADAVAVLNAMSGSDADAVTADADKENRFRPLSGASLQRQGLGVVMPAPETPLSESDLLLAQALEALKARGAEIVTVSDFAPPPQIGADEKLVLQYDFKNDLNLYLASLPASPVHTLSDLIAFNDASPRETALFGQSTFIASNARAICSPEYVRTRDELISQGAAL
jgi:amidase